MPWTESKTRSGSNESRNVDSPDFVIKNATYVEEKETEPVQRVNSLKHSRSFKHSIPQKTLVKQESCSSRKETPASPSPVPPTPDPSSPSHPGPGPSSPSSPHLNECKV